MLTASSISLLGGHSVGGRLEICFVVAFLPSRNRFNARFLLSFFACSTFLLFLLCVFASLFLYLERRVVHLV